MRENEIVGYFAEHYEEYLKFAVTVTRSLDSAQDVLQTVALVLCKKADELHGIENPGGYLTVCVRRTAINHIKQASRALPTDPTMLAAAHTDDGQIAQSYVEWTLSLEKHLAGYSEELQKAFIAFYLDGYSLEQVAAHTGLTTAAMSQQFKRMRTRLAKQSPILGTLIVLLSSL